MNHHMTARQMRARRSDERARKRAEQAASAKFRGDLKVWGETMPTWQRELLSTDAPAGAGAVPTSPAVLAAMAEERGATTLGTVVVFLAAVLVGFVAVLVLTDDPADTPTVDLVALCSGNVSCVETDDGGVNLHDEDNGTGWHIGPDAVSGDVGAVAVILEDSPGWDCSTMGNEICGPVSVVLNPDGSAEVHDNPPQDQMGDTLRAWIPSGGVVHGVDPIELPAPCDGPAGVGAVLVMSDTVHAGIISDHVDDATDPTDGPCLLAVAVVTVG